MDKHAENVLKCVIYILIIIGFISSIFLFLGSFLQYSLDLSHSSSYKNLLNIFDFPIKVFSGSLAVYLARVVVIRMIQSQKQLEYNESIFVRDAKDRFIENLKDIIVSSYNNKYQFPLVNIYLIHKQWFFDDNGKWLIPENKIHSSVIKTLEDIDQEFKNLEFIKNTPNQDSQQFLKNLEIRYGSIFTLFKRINIPVYIKPKATIDPINYSIKNVIKPIFELINKQEEFFKVKYFSENFRH